MRFGLVLRLLRLLVVRSVWVVCMVCVLMRLMSLGIVLVRSLLVIGCLSIRIGFSFGMRWRRVIDWLSACGRYSVLPAYLIVMFETT